MALARIKATRSPMRIASSASWVTTIEVARVSCRMASVSSRIFSRRRESRLRNGVHKEHAWSRRDGAGKRHALLLFARRDVRIFARIMSEADALERGMCLGLGLAPGER
jgi:hypothetical protein